MSHLIDRQRRALLAGTAAGLLSAELALPREAPQAFTESVWALASSLR